MNDKPGLLNNGTGQHPNRVARVALGLAPMEGVTDLPTRLWFTQTSAPDFATTPFLRITRDYPSKRVPATFCPEMSVLKNLTPGTVAPQLMASSVDDLCRLGEHFLKFTPFIDINCGCPAPTVVGNGAGSALLMRTEIFSEYVNAVCAQLGHNQVSIKMRTGFADCSEFTNLLDVLLHCSPVRLTVHGRTRADRYLGTAKWNLIEMAARAFAENDGSEENSAFKRSGLKVVGSGDITCINSLNERLAQAPHIQNIIVGRGAIRNPWIFQELRTGAPVRLSLAALQWALACFVLLQELCEQKPTSVFDLALEGLFLRSAGTEVELWQALYAKLLVAFLGESHAFVPPSELEVGRGSFCKLKMVWNSMRSALPPPFFGPEPLRANSLSQFFAALDLAAQAHSQQTGFAAGRDLLVLKYDAHHDWVYSGGGKGEKRGPAGEVEHLGGTAAPIPVAAKQG